MRFRFPDLETVDERRCPSGHVAVRRCYPLRWDGDRPLPFPTLFWLACPHLTREMARLEHDGWVARVESRIEEDDTLRRRVHADHRDYAEERRRSLRDVDRPRLLAAGLESSLDVGIGGIRNRDAVKCLHLHYAHHLARGSAIGELIDRLGEVSPCRAS